MRHEEISRLVRVIVSPGADPTQPGLYEWRLPDGWCYIGQYGRPSRPLKQYLNNVGRLLDGRPRRAGQPLFRAVHVELATAFVHGQEVTLTYHENVNGKPERNRREGELVALRRSEQAAGGPRVLNGLPARSRPDARPCGWARHGSPDHQYVNAQ